MNIKNFFTYVAVMVAVSTSAFAAKKTKYDQHTVDGTSITFELSKDFPYSDSDQNGSERTTFYVKNPESKNEVGIGVITVPAHKFDSVHEWVMDDVDGKLKSHKVRKLRGHQVHSYVFTGKIEGINCTITIHAFQHEDTYVGFALFCRTKAVKGNKPLLDHLIKTLQFN